MTQYTGAPNPVNGSRLPMSAPGALSTAALRQLTIPQIETLLEEGGGGDAHLWGLLERDERTGVRRLAVRARRRRGRQAADEARRHRLQEAERQLWGRGIARVAGVDEVGRGCLAGPVVAAAVILPPGTGIPGLDDSKALTPATRESLSVVIAEQAAAVAVAAVGAADIDRINILQASMRAMREALEGLEPPPDQVLVDGNRGPGSRFPERALVGGDGRSVSIAAASVVAKVHRDRLMVAYDEEFPGYGFAKHKGYASPHHLDALSERGPCRLHRMSFRPVAPSVKAADGETPSRSLQLGLRAGQAAGLGRRGEVVAARHLESLGWRVLARGYRGAGGEIDLVAADGDCLVFVEVKTGKAGGLVPPESRVPVEQRAHLVRAARHYLLRHPVPGECRFDVVAVSVDGNQPHITHLRDAFIAPSS